MPELSTLGHVIKPAYEAQPNTNAFTDAEKSKLSGIESEATKNSSDGDLLERANHTGVQAAASIIDLPDLLAGKVDAEDGKGLSDANFTHAEKDKLAQLEDGHFKGVFVGLQALEDAHPEGDPGDYAVVDDGVDLVWYQWDSTEWSVRQGESADITPAQVKAYYESNPDTNAFTDGEKSGLANLLASNRFTFRRLGTWNAATNTPELLNGTGVNGDFYVVTVPGTRDFGVGPSNFRVQDWVIYAGGVWQRLTVADQLLDWADIQNKPDIVEPRGTISPPIPAVYRRAGTAQSIPARSVTKITAWTGSGYDIFGMGDGSDFTVPAWASHARVTTEVRTQHIKSADASHLWVAVYLDGAVMASGQTQGTDSLSYPAALTTTGIIPVTAGQKFNIRAWHNDTTDKALYLGGACFINIELFEAI